MNIEYETQINEYYELSIGYQAKRVLNSKLNTQKKKMATDSCTQFLDSLTN